MENTVIEGDRSLISSDRVEGTHVYNPAGDKLGTISHVMIDKKSGKTEYAVMSFGGFFGLGSDHYPIPWSLLDYDVDKGGYVVALEKERLSGAPRFSPDERPEYDRIYNERVLTYYGLPII